MLVRTYADEELVESLKAGKAKAFDELFQRYWGKAFEIAYGKTRSKVVAEEIVQEIFMDLWNKRHTLSIQSFPNYLFKAVKYQALNRIRSQIVHRKFWVYYKTFIPQADDTTEKTVRLHDLLHNIEKRLDHLPQKTKKIFFMNKLEGKSLKEIANILGLSEKAIEYHLSRSLKELRVYLRDALQFAFLACLM